MSVAPAIAGRAQERIARLQDLVERFLRRVEEIQQRSQVRAELPAMVEILRRENEKLLRRVQALERRQASARRKIAAILQEMDLQGIHG